MKNKFLTLIAVTFLLIEIVSAVIPSTTKIQIIITNNTIEIKGDDIIDFSDTFQINYTNSSDSTTNNITAWIDYIKNTELVFVNVAELNDTSLSCLNEYNKMTQKWEDCINLNSNLSIRNIILEDDAGYKENYTVCKQELTNKEGIITSKNIEVTNKQKEIEDAKSKNYWYYGGSALVGVAICYFYLRREGKIAPVNKMLGGYPTAKLPTSEVR